MGSDRARITYDPKQQYRSVVMQQGRVTLEADWNEAWQITNEELRQETLDFVGPCGTPDDGYKVVLIANPTPPYDFFISSGTMYVGGMRAYLYDPVQYSNQPDWRDTGAEDPDWVDPNSFTASPANPPLNEFVYLLLREQEVSAVEDFDLKDVALGGPDTAQRARLLQRFVRLASQGTDCVSGLAAAEAKWQTEGLYFNPDTMRLNSWGTLMVGFSDQKSDPDPCQPQARGGYLDPDNQLIRVQISGIDPATGNPKFVWGFDDASFLYRISVDPNNPQNLVFQSVPVDSNHQPLTGQAVEVLRTAADLPNGGEIAAAKGFVFTLSQTYDPDSQSIVMPAGIPLPLDYTTANQSPENQLFLRVWQQEVVFTPGTPVALGDTGVLVTLAPQASGQPFHFGDYWMFAVRPATPQTVYPERYQNAPQPADGPRMWACPLAVVSWNEQQGVISSDCRNPFDNLVELTKQKGGCCTVAVRPQDVSGARSLQSLVDSLANPALTIAAIDGGFTGNNISVEISNVRSELNPITFDLTVTDAVTFFGMTVNEVEPTIGNETIYSPLPAHVIQSSVNAQGVPVNTQIVTFSNARFSSARVDIVDANQNPVFTLEAKKPGDDGNLTTASVTNLDTTANTFDLTLSWTKTLSGLTLANCIQSINSGLAYDIRASAPAGRSPSIPLEGVVALTGGYFDGLTTVIIATANIFGNPSTLCLSPGVYNLPTTLQLTNAHSNLTIESCSGAATLAAIPGEEKNFQQGLVSVVGAGNITLRGLTFRLPPAQFFSSDAIFESSIGMRPIDCQSLTVEDCMFLYPQMRALNQLHAAISAEGNMLGIELRGNIFNGPSNFIETLDSGIGASFELLGYVQGSSDLTTSDSGSTNTGKVLPSTLDGAIFRANNFQNLSFAVLIQANVGKLKFDSNSISNSYFGILLIALAGIAPMDKSQISATRTALNLPDILSSGASLDILHRGISGTVTFPLPVNYKPQRLVSRATAPTAKSNASARASVVTPSGVAPQATSADVPLVQPPLNLQFSNNDIDTVLTLANNLSPVKTRTLDSGTAIELAMQTATPDSMLLMTGNKLRNQSSVSPTVVISAVSRCVIAGNLILNEASELGKNAAGAFVAPPSLSMINIPEVPTVLVGKQTNVHAIAVTGNVFRGQPTIPPREPILAEGLPALTPPMEHWEAYNTEV